MCDTVAIVANDRVFFAKNSDRDPNEAQRLEWHPATEHSSGELVQCTWIAIPQVRYTHATLLSRPFWMWGAEIGTNEHGVTIGNEAVFTKHPVSELGLTGMDLLRLALERASSAEQAVSVIVELLETWGQGGGCGHEDPGFRYHNSYIVADRTRAFVLETAARHWAAEEISGARTISNGLTIPGFAERHSDKVKTAVSQCRHRQSRSQTLANDVHDAGSLFALLRDHGESAEPQWSIINGAMSAPCMHAGGLVAASQTTASWVSELSNRTTRHWVTGTAAPCTSLFKPVSVNRPLDLGHPTDRADSSLWWQHERLHRRVLQSAGSVELYRAERNDVERSWLRDPPDSAEAFAEDRLLRQEWLSTVRDANLPDRRPLWLRRYWRLRNKRAGLDVG